MKQITTLLLLLVSTLSIAQIVEFEDPNFKTYLIEEGVDLNSDGEIQYSEAEQVTTLPIGSTPLEQEISSLVGIKAFTNLAELMIDAPITSLDVSGMQSLEILTMYAWQMPMTSISIVDCNQLREFTFEGTLLQNDFVISELQSLESIRLYCDNQVIKISNLQNLQFVDIAGQLEGSLSIKECPSLTILNLMTLGNFTDIDISNLPALTDLFIDASGDAGKLDISNCVSLTSLDIIPASLDTLDISGCTSLAQLQSLGGSPKVMLARNCVSLTSIFVEIEEFLDLYGCSSLQEIEFWVTPKTLNLTGCFNLLRFKTDNTDSEILDFSSCPNLTEIDFGYDAQVGTLILKNNSSSETLQSVDFDFIVIDNICVDPDELNYITNLFSPEQLSDMAITTSCNAFNGGLPYSAKGMSYLDINDDNCATSDITLPLSKYSLSQNGQIERYVFANNAGQYNAFTFEGDYTIRPEVLYGDDLFTTSPEEYNVSFPADGSIVEQDFCFTPGLVVDILEVTIIPLGAARPGFTVDYLINYTNSGNIVKDGKIQFEYPTDVTSYESSDQAPDVEEDGFLSWEFEGLVPYESRQIIVTMQLNSPMDTPPLNGDDVITYEAQVDPIGNQTVSSYWATLNQTVVNSFDPNDKTCLEGDILDVEMIGDYLKYMIRFENTGSAEAVNIVVTDSIDPLSFDIKTLEVLSASHDVETIVEGNVIDFIFKNIYLPFDDATNDGYVTFKIKTLETLTLGDDLRNKAEIFFDFNFPIITNTTSTVVSETTAVSDLKVVTESLTISPNPAANTCTLSSTYPITKIEIFDTQGKLVRSIEVTALSTTYELQIRHLPAGMYIVKGTHEKGIAIGNLMKG